MLCGDEKEGEVFENFWWTWTGSNRRPLPCHGSALRTAPQAHANYVLSLTYTVFMDRQQAWGIVCEFVKSESLRKHMLAVDTCVAAYAQKSGEDEEKWAVTALLHDFDSEIHPNLPHHPTKGEPLLADRGLNDE